MWRKSGMGARRTGLGCWVLDACCSKARRTAPDLQHQRPRELLAVGAVDVVRQAGGAHLLQISTQQRLLGSLRRGRAPARGLHQGRGRLQGCKARRAGSHRIRPAAGGAGGGWSRRRRRRRRQRQRQGLTAGRLTLPVFCRRCDRLIGDLQQGPDVPLLASSSPRRAAWPGPRCTLSWLLYSDDPALNLKETSGEGHQSRNPTAHLSPTGL